MQTTRPPAVSGTFYADNAQALSNDVRAMLGLPDTDTSATNPKCIIVPHAGYVYSGPTAATAYRHLYKVRHVIRRVVVLGPAHRVPIRGLALPGVQFFATPLGTVEIDQGAVALLSDLPQVVVSSAAHAQEHSLEVQIPFLQSVLDEFKLLPLVVGDATPTEVAQVLKTVWGGEETLIVISSDLSHFLPYAQAQAKDSKTVRNIMELQPVLTHEQACGATPINGLLIAARRFHLKPELLEVCNSGDTAGDKDRVVGYASFAFVPKTPEATSSNVDGKVLLSIARAAISTALGRTMNASEEAPWLFEPGACFVTLTQSHQLRGCIGSLQAHRSLMADVKANAVAAALHDSRFAPLTLAELHLTDVEISVLSAMQPLAWTSEADALSQLRPGVDGVVFGFGHHHSTFLPQVWEQLPTAQIFMAHLKHKAGLPPDFWDEGVQLQRYTVSKWKEGG
jgi:AmmeMemoRadiSam system protein B/AmmeMemoRadiSam system protein A